MSGANGADLATLRRTWDHLGAVDPMWAILSRPGTSGNRWATPDFFATGRREVQATFARLAALGLTCEPGAAFDFGCGVGRLSQAMAERFATVDGVDIAPSMVRRARAHNRHGERCRYHVLGAPGLAEFAGGAFHFVLSLLVLQHVHPRHGAVYIRELVRLLAPGGVLVMNVPSRPSATPLGVLTAMTPQPVVRAVTSVRRGRHGVRDIYGIPRRDVHTLIRAAGGVPILEERDDALGRRWETFRYYVGKPNGTH